MKKIVLLKNEPNLEYLKISANYDYLTSEQLLYILCDFVNFVRLLKGQKFGVGLIHINCFLNSLSDLYKKGGSSNAQKDY